MKNFKFSALFAALFALLFVSTAFAQVDIGNRTFRDSVTVKTNLTVEGGTTAAGITASSLTGKTGAALTVAPASGQDILMPIRQADITSTCTAGTWVLDTGGANNELCFCKATDTWMCITATTITGPTN